MNHELIFVYNASSDLFSAVTDFAHKVISPSTYQCYLCTLTYGTFTMEREWKSFLRSLPVKTRFLYKDKFAAKYNRQEPLPAVFISANGDIRQLITKTEIENCRSIEELKTAVTTKLHQHLPAFDL